MKNFKFALFADYNVSLCCDAKKSSFQVLAFWGCVAWVSATSHSLLKTFHANESLFSALYVVGMSYSWITNVSKFRHSENRSQSHLNRILCTTQYRFKHVSLPLISDSWKIYVSVNLRRSSTIDNKLFLFDSLKNTL